MRSLMTLLSGASLGAGGMYPTDPDRGHRRRAELRDALAEVDSERSHGTGAAAGAGRRTVRQLGGRHWGYIAMLEPAR